MITYISTGSQAVKLCDQVIEMCRTESTSPSRLDMKKVQQILEDVLCEVSQNVGTIEVIRKPRRKLKHWSGQNEAGDI